MSGIIISDSEPVDTENLVLCEKIDLFLTANIGHQIYTMKQLGLTQKFGLLLLLMKQNAAIQKKLL